MTEFDLNNPFNEAPKDGMLADGCGIFERYYTNGQEIDLCGLSPDPKDFDNPQTLYQKILDLVKRIIIAVDLNTNGTYKPSDFDIYPIIANATSVKDAIEKISKYVEELQEGKFDKLNLKLKYDNGIVSLMFNDEPCSSINIPEEQFLDNEETVFIPSATTEDWKKDSSVVIGKPYLRLAFKTIDSSGSPTVTYTYIPMSYLFNVYSVDDTDSIDMHLNLSGDTNILKADLRVNDDTTNALKVDVLGAYVENLTPMIEAEVTRAKDAEKELSDNLDTEITRATNMEYNIINMVSNETDRAIKEEEKLKTLITNETTRADEVEQQLYKKIQEEKERASNAEMDLKDELDLEIQRSKNKDAQLTQKIEDETIRAKDAENSNKTTISNEITRAKTEESRLNGLISDNTNAIVTEETRAKGEEKRIETKFDKLVSDNTNSLEAEIIRAKKAEQANTDAIKAEETRAKAEEAALITKIDTDIKAESDRAKDVEKQLSDGLNAEVIRAKDAEKVLTEDLTDEITRAKDEESRIEGLTSANTTAIENEVKRAEAAEKTLTDNLSAEIIRAKAEEKTNADAIKAEETRAKAAEKVNADAILTKLTKPTNVGLPGQAPVLQYDGTIIWGDVQMDIPMYNPYDLSDMGITEGVLFTGLLINGTVEYGNNSGYYANYNTTTDKVEIYDNTSTLVGSIDVDKEHRNTITATISGETQDYYIAANDTWEPLGLNVKNYYKKTEVQSLLSVKANKTDVYDKSEINSKLNDKQDKLVSGTNIKTVNSQNILGSGNLLIENGVGIVSADLMTTTDNLSEVDLNIIKNDSFPVIIDSKNLVWHRQSMDNYHQLYYRNIDTAITTFLFINSNGAITRKNLTLLTSEAQTFLTDSQKLQARTNIGAESTSNKGIANGYAGLNSDKKIDISNLPIASASELGVIKAGLGLGVDSNGVLNYTGTQHYASYWSSSVNIGSGLSIGVHSPIAISTLTKIYGSALQPVTYDIIYTNDGYQLLVVTDTLDSYNRIDSVIVVVPPPTAIWSAIEGNLPNNSYIPALKSDNTTGVNLIGVSSNNVLTIGNNSTPANINSNGRLQNNSQTVAYESDVTTETNARKEADNNLTDAINAEETARKKAVSDEALARSEAISKVQTNLDNAISDINTTTDALDGKIDNLLTESDSELNSHSKALTAYKSTSLLTTVYHTVTDVATKNDLLPESQLEYPSICFVIDEGIQYINSKTGGGWHATGGNFLTSDEMVDYLVDNKYIKSNQVINNLTSTSTDAPLSANMGKYLNDNKLSATQVINNVVTSDVNNPLSANMGKYLNDNKLSSNDVINNLSSTSAVKPLSANQGKVVNDKITKVEGYFGSGANAGKANKALLADSATIADKLSSKKNLTININGYVKGSGSITTDWSSNPTININTTGGDATSNLQTDQTSWYHYNKIGTTACLFRYRIGTQQSFELNMFDNFQSHWKFTYFSRPNGASGANANQNWFITDVRRNANYQANTRLCLYQQTDGYVYCYLVGAATYHIAGFNVTVASEGAINLQLLPMGNNIAVNLPTTTTVRTFINDLNLYTATDTNFKNTAYSGVMKTGYVAPV